MKGGGGPETPPPLPLLRITALPFEALAPLAPGAAAERLDRVAAAERDLAGLAESLADQLFAVAGPPDPEAGPEAARARLAAVALRRAVFNRRELRRQDLERARPCLSPDLDRRLDAYAARRRELTELEAGVGAAFAADLAAARRALLEAVRQPGFQAAIRLVSRGLLERLRGLGEPRSWRHDERLAAGRLSAYLGRAATKTSPNDLFCATAPAAWASPEGGAGVGGENRFDRLEVLLNVTEARKVAACLGAGEAAWPALVPRVNPTLHREDGAWTFWRPSSLGQEEGGEILRRLRHQPVAELFLRLAGPGTRTVPELIEAAAEAAGASADDLAPFFARLADVGLLSREIEIPYTCPRPLAFLAGTVRAAGCRPPWLAEVEAVEAEVGRLPELAPEERIAVMDRLTGRLDALPHARPLAGDELFRLDAVSALRVTLPCELPAELRAAVGGYARLFAALYPRKALRRGLARRFLAEHGPDREVDLLTLYRGEVLRESPTAGRPQGFPDAAGGSGGEASTALERARAWFAARARDAEAAGREEVEIREQDWQHLSGGAAEPPWAAGVLFQVAAAGPAELAAGRWRAVLSDLFPGIGLALSRFARLHGGETRGNPIVEEIARKAARLAPPGAILAEVAFNHWGRAANAGLRLPFLEHEIELPGEKASPGATVLPLSELTLRWSSAEERLVLTWQARGIEVVPVITSGISSEGFVSLLVGVGRQRILPLAFFPGFEAEMVRRWPRYVHRRVVVFRRRWIFPPGEYPEPPAGGGRPERLLGDFFARLHRWRRAEELPRHLFAASSREAKPFHVDLASPLSADLLRRLLLPPPGEEAPTLYLTEMLPGPDDLWVRDARGRYATELLVQMGGG